MYLRFLKWLHRYDTHPNFNRFGAGLYQLLWIRWCRREWKFAFRIARLYWFGKILSTDAAYGHHTAS